MNATDTPRTDKLVSNWNHAAAHPLERVAEAVAHAKQLERELRDMCAKQDALTPMDWKMELDFPGHRLLQPGETIQTGDEAFMGGMAGWGITSLAGRQVPEPVKKNPIYRRKL